MNFWDTVEGLFTGDTYFPDNVHRAARVAQLVCDCKQYAVQLTSDAEKFESKQYDLNSTLVKVLGRAKKLPDGTTVENVKLGGEKWTIEVSQLIAPLLTYPAVSTALTPPATSYLVSSGEIGAIGLVSLIALPIAFESAIGLTAGVFAIGAVFGLGAIAGAVKRSKLRAATQHLIPDRAKLYKVYLINHKLLQLINTMIQVVGALNNAGVDDITVMERVHFLVTKATFEIDNITDSVAIEKLSVIDTARHAWTNEDPTSISCA